MQSKTKIILMAIMGHKTRVMFDRYNVITESDQRAYATCLLGRSADKEVDNLPVADGKVDL